MMIKPDCINFDCIEQQSSGRTTDIIGKIENLERIFDPETFDTILCYHVIEHFLPQDSQKMLRDCFSLLSPGGALVVEGPDIEKILNNWRLEKVTTRDAIQEIYGDPKYTEAWMHKWGWTGKTTADEMRRCGFQIRFVGDGISHNKTDRDFRVEGVKP